MAKYALVTGGGTGIGFGCAQALIEAGFTVTIAGRRAEPLEAAAATLRGAGGDSPEVRTVVCDVADEEQVAAAVAAATGPDGQLDASIANAGTGTGKPILLMTADDLRSLYEPNVYGAFNTIKHSALAMRDHGGGAIVAISSIAGALGGRFRSAYASSKAALEMIVRVAADELGPFDIRVNSIRPGLVPSEVTAALTDPEAEGVLREMQDTYLENMPISRLGEPSEIGALAAFLCGDHARWITGQQIACDGGHTIRRAPNLEAGLRAGLGEEAVDRLVGPRWR